MNYLLISVLVLGAIAVISAVVLYVCSKKFAVKTDPRVGEVYELLPKANCGGCGLAGCQAMAEALVAGADNGGVGALTCPVGGGETMARIAAVLGIECGSQEPPVAVVRCQGCQLAPIAEYDGLRTCAAMNACSTGQGGCGQGCLGCGDCVEACGFGGISINPSTGTAQVDEKLCTACGACAKACPRHIIELRPRGIKGRRVYVACRNQDKGPVAMKVCGTSCIACGKCAKECPFGAISVDGGIAYIDPQRCKSCRKCEKACPRKAILAVGFPAPRVARPATEEPAKVTTTV